LVLKGVYFYNLMFVIKIWRWLLYLEDCL